MSFFPPLARSLSFLAAAGLLLTSFAAEAKPVKIGYFSVERVMAELDDAKAAFDRLQRSFEEKQTQLDRRREELERMARDFEQKAAVYSQAQKEQIAQELQLKYQEAQRLMFEMQSEQAQQHEATLAGLLSKLEPVVSEVAASQGYTHVFEKRESGLFVAPTADDLTSEVIRRYNARYAKKPAGNAGTKGSTKGGKK